MHFYNFFVFAMIHIIKVPGGFFYLFFFSGFSFGLYCSVMQRYETLSGQMTAQSMGLSQLSFGSRMCTFVSCGADVDIDLLVRSFDTNEADFCSFLFHQLQLYTISFIPS